MIEEILPRIFRIKLPLPRNPLRELNSYLIRSKERSLLIDTGMNREECRNVIVESLRQLDVDLERMDIFITHHHADHLGQTAFLARTGSKAYIHKEELSTVGNEATWQAMLRFFASNGFPEQELQSALASHPGHRYQLRDKVNFSYVDEGDLISAGDYYFRCVITPGHSPAHTCLYEASKKILVSGDHILFDITPNISQQFAQTNPLKDYIASLDKVYPLEANITLPGHRDISNNHRKRIGELKHHHQERCNEVLEALSSGEHTAFEVASQISWDIDAETWELFPPRQKWFAIGETLAHIKLVEEEGRVRCRCINGQFWFSLS
jgi:glyoxylase-like metal-dependent hydrolase (beta-lactamase superfamily II)